MARGTQLQQLVSDLRAEVGLSLKVSVGVDQEDRYKYILRRTQATLWSAHEWPFMQAFFSKALSAGQRYYDMPTGLSDMRIIAAAIDDGGEEPLPVDQGVDFEQYIAYNSDEDERADPVLRWDFRRTSSTTTQIEVWPIPSTNNQTLWFKGQRDLPALTANTHTAALDDNLIVAFAGAEIAARMEDKSANLKLQMARDLLRILKGQGTGPAKVIAMGQGVPPRRGSGPIIRIGS